MVLWFGGGRIWYDHIEGVIHYITWVYSKTVIFPFGTYGFSLD